MKNTDLEKSLGGSTEIQNNANAWDMRTSQSPLLNKDKQPVLYSLIEQRAKQLGISLEEYQTKF